MRIQFIIFALELLWNYCDEFVKEGTLRERERKKKVRTETSDKNSTR